MAFEQPEQLEQYKEQNPEVFLEDVKVLLEKKQQILNDLHVAETLSAEERKKLAEEIASSEKETKEELKKTEENIKPVFDKTIQAFERSGAPTDKLEEITTRFLRAQNTSEALEALHLLEEFLPKDQKSAA